MMVEHQHLVLEHFAQVPHIEFGKIHPGTTATAILTLHNPTNQVQRVDIDPVSEPTLTLNPVQLELSPESKQDVCLTWTPIEGSVTGKNYRVAISIRMDGRKRFKAVMTGVSVIKSGRTSRRKPARSESTFELTEIDENIIRNGPTSIAWKADFKKPSSSAEKTPTESAANKSTHFAIEGVSKNPFQASMEGALRKHSQMSTEGAFKNHSQTSTEGALKKYSQTPVESVSKKQSESTVPIISPSKIAPYFAKAKEGPQDDIEIDIDEKLLEKHPQIDVIIDDRKPRKGGIAFDADFTIKLPKAKPNKSTLLRAEGTPSKPVDIKPIVRKGSVVPLIDHAAKRKALTEISRGVLTPAKKKLKAPVYSYREGQFYDEDWATKRENAFKIWLNLIFKEKETPQAFIIDRDSSYQSIKELRAHAQILQKAFSCYHSKPVQGIIRAIEQAICSGQMRIRDDINMLNDVGLRDRFVDLLHSYNSTWLKLGLETVYGEMLPTSSCLRNFIQSRLLSNVELDNEHTYLKTPQGQAFFNERHKSAMQSFVLKKVMQLVLFLDIAKAQSVFPVSPCLFVIGGNIKSTRSLLIELASIFMAAQGDVVKFIAQISGYECCAVQTPLDEFNYQITDLVGDLKDGVRLCALTEQPGLERQILLPAINKSRKKHNVSLALQAFANLGVPITQGTADDIIDGNHQRILVLLWNIISHLTIPSLLDIPTLFNEVRLLRRQTKLLYKDELTCNLFADNTRLQLLLRWCQVICLRYEIVIRNFTSSFSDGRGFAAIISYYYPQLIKESDIRRTTRSLQEQLKKKKSGICSSDDMSGAAWIQFLHLQASHEEVLEGLEGERQNWRLVADAVRRLGYVPFVFSEPGRNMKQSMVLDENTVILFLSYLCSRLLTLSKESHAARVVQRQWRDIQYRKRVLLIPTTVEKLSDTLLSCYHYIRCQAFFKRIRVAQSALSSYLQQKELKKQWLASWTIQRFWKDAISRRRLARIKAAVDVLQGPLSTFINHSNAANYMLQIRILQGTFRTSLSKSKMQRMKSAANVISLHLERYRQCRAAFKLQRKWRHYKQEKRRRLVLAAINVLSGPLLSSYQYRLFDDYLSKMRSIQGTCQTYLQTKTMSRLRLSTNTIGAQLRFYLQWRAATALQRHWREMKRRQKARRTREAAPVLSGPIRSWALYRQSQQYLCAISSIQHASNAFLARRSFDRTKSAVSALELHLCRYKQFRAAVTIQKQWRFVTCRKRFSSTYDSATVLSACLKSYHQHITAATYLQRVYTAQGAAKTYFEYQQHLRLHLASNLVSTHLRRYLTWKAACTLQKRWREYRQRQRELAVRASSTILSGALLSYCQHSTFSRHLYTLSLLQGSARSYNKCKDFLELERATVIAQSRFRAYIAWRSAVRIQTYWRGLRARQRMRRIRFSVATLGDSLLSLSHHRQAVSYSSVVKTLQSAITTSLQHRHLQELQHAAKVIARHFHHYQSWMAARTLQKAWRDSQRRKRQRLVVSATAVLYGPLLSCFANSIFNTRMAKVSVLQCATKAFLREMQSRAQRQAASFLGTQIRRYNQHRAAVCLQKNWRCFAARKRMRLVCGATATLQNSFLSLSDCRKFTNYLGTVSALQGFAKTFLHYKRIERLQGASSVISLYFRRYQSWQAACSLQRHWRENRRRKRVRSVTAAVCTLSGALLSVHQSAVCKNALLRIRTLQAALKTLLQLQDINRRREARILNAVTSIQSAFFAITSINLSRRLLQSRRLHSCIKIQRAVRHYFNYQRYSREQRRICSTHTLLAAFNCVIAVRSAHRYQRSVVKLQSLWRGRAQRLKASKKVRRARERIVEASSRWTPELTIGYRLKQALDVLLSGSKLSELTQACRMLDHVTKTLPGCSIDAVEHNAVPVLYALMRGLNRSKPHIELLGYAVSILATLSENPMVSQHVFSDESCLDVMLELLQTQRENPDLFIKIATLLTRGCDNPAFAAELRASSKRIASIHALLSRKLDMNVRYQQPGSSAHTRQTALLAKSVKAVESLQRQLL